ncbi:MAG: hypothetical protein ABTQ25_16015 [Nitrosomonas ureae]
MEYYRYFDLFLSIEDELAGYMRQLQFSSKTESLYSPRILLLLLQTCPVIESYMVQISTRSIHVKKHPLYDWEGANKLWQSDQGKIKEKAGSRSISNFPKFAYVVEKVFRLSSKSCIFYYSERFKDIDGDSNFKSLTPFETLSSFIDYQNANIEPRKQFPIGLNSPKWWIAYNKIKHELDEAENRVTYQIAIEALGALFVLLSNCDTDINVLQRNGFIADGKIKSRLFSGASQHGETQ